MEAVVVPYPNDHKIIDMEQPIDSQEVEEEKYFDYSKRALWLRAVILGGHEGLVSTTLLIIGMGTVMHDTKAMILSSFIGIMAGALSTAVAEFVSVYTQVDIMAFQVQRNVRMGRGGQMGLVPSPSQVAVSALLSYLAGGTVPLLAAGFIRHDGHQLRLFVAATVACLYLFVLGSFGAALGKTPIGTSCARVMVGGTIAIGIMLGKSQLFGILGIKTSKYS